MNISFFSPKDDDSVVIDFDVIREITKDQFQKLSVIERNFVLLIQRELGKGLQGIHTLGTTRLQDSSQESICAEFLRMFNARSLEDPDIF